MEAPLRVFCDGEMSNEMAAASEADATKRTAGRTLILTVGSLNFSSIVCCLFFVVSVVTVLDSRLKLGTSGQSRQ